MGADLLQYSTTDSLVVNSASSPFLALAHLESSRQSTALEAVEGMQEGALTTKQSHTHTTFTRFTRAPTDEVVHPVAQHVGGLGGTVEAEVLGHGLLLRGLAHLLRSTEG